MMLAVILIIVILSILSPFIVATIILLPYIRVGVARAKILIGIRSVAGERGFLWRPLRRFPFLSLNTSRGYDFALIGKEKILVVKLWSAVNAQNTALVCENGALIERSVIPEPMSAGAKQRRTVRLKKRRFPTLERNFPAKSRRPIETLILYCPQYASTFVRRDGKNVLLRPGEKLFGATLCDQNTIYRFL